ncbi:MAG TPA: MarR family transcriptional regulator [Devosia sp.]|nr:MarR family transcriptional regulator [Devosia sp.]
MHKSTYLPRDFTGDLIVAGRLWRRLTRAATARHGLAEAGVAPLLWIGRLGEGVRQNVVAEKIGVEGASLVRVLDELTTAGFVTREPDPSDRRANLLQLTSKGRDTVARLEGDINELRNCVLGALDPADIAGAERVFAAIKAAAECLPASPLEAMD